MAILDKLNEFTKSLGDSETSKFNSKITSEQNAINEVMKKIGEYCYNKYTETGKADKGIAEFCTTIDGHNKAIATAKVEIERIKAEREAAVSAGAAPVTGACPACGAKNEAGRKFCSECGGKLETDKRICACGARIAPGAKFCAECGAKIK
jgi:predicted nucleic acid-binding Zn ribbon protein